MTIIYIMVFTLSFFPSLVIGREEDIGSLGGVVYLGKAKPIGNIHCLGIYTCSTYYIYIIVVDAVLTTFLKSAMLQCLVERGIALASGERCLRATEHYVAAVRQCALGQREECAATHDDGMTSGEGLETLQVVGQPVYQFVVMAYSPVAGHSRDNIDFHLLIYYRCVLFISTVSFTFVGLISFA